MNRKEMWGNFLPPKSDLAFKEMMRNETVRRHFISTVLDIPLEEIRSVHLENTFLSRRSRSEKQCILDVRILLNDNSRINVEIQIRPMKHWDKRSVYYMSKMYTDGLGWGQKYDRLKKCIVINLLDFPLDEEPAYHRVCLLRDEKGWTYSDQLEVHIIELNKELTGDRVDDWIRLFRVKNREELNMFKSRNPGIMEAVREVREMNLSKWIKAWFEERMKDQRDRWAYEDTARDEGRLEQSRQSILDLLEELGDIPVDISALIYAEKDVEVLRRWLKAAAKATSFDSFRDIIRLT